MQSQHGTLSATIRYRYQELPAGSQREFNKCDITAWLFGAENRVSIGDNFCRGFAFCQCNHSRLWVDKRWDRRDTDTKPWEQLIKRYLYSLNLEIEAAIPLTIPCCVSIGG